MHNFSNFFRFFILLYIGIFIAPLFGINPDFVLEVKSAVLIDNSTGFIIYEHNSDLPYPPASLTKLMSLYIAYKDIESGIINKTDPVTISSNACWFNQPPHSSLMFLETGQSVTYLELMRGLAISSGNDAAVALAENISGGSDHFVTRMNREADLLGYEVMHFEDSSGYSEFNQITAGEFADFCIKYINTYPSSLTEIHSLRSFTYPDYHNMQREGARIDYRITQQNHNLIQWEFDGCDGLKTGYIDESGYNLAATAFRDGMRLTAILLGINAETSKEGGEKRAKLGGELLSFGFDNFTTVRLGLPELPPLRIWGGSEDYIYPVVDTVPLLTLYKEDADSLITKLTYNRFINFPINHGDIIGTISYYCGIDKVYEVQIKSSVQINKGSIFKRIKDTFIRFIGNLLLSDN